MPSASCGASSTRLPCATVPLGRLLPERRTHRTCGEARPGADSVAARQPALRVGEHVAWRRCMVTGLLRRLVVHRGSLWAGHLVRSRHRCFCSTAAAMTGDPAPAAAGKKAAAARRDTDDAAGPAKKAKAPAAERTSIPRCEMPRKAGPGGPTFKALSWNVAGLRGLLNNGNGSVLRDLVESEQPDVVCLQEHKLQASHVAECEAQLRTLLGPRYGAFYWAVSVEKKGYSGIVVI